MGTIRKKELKSGVKYEARIQHRGKHTESKLFNRLKSFKNAMGVIEEGAEAWIARKEAEILNGQTRTRNPEKILLGEVFQEYLSANEETVKQKDGTEKIVTTLNIREKYRVEMLNHDWHARAVSTVTDTAIQSWIAAGLKTNVPKQRRTESKNKHYLYDGDTDRTYAPATMRKFYYTLKKVMRWHAKKHNYLFNENAFTSELVSVPNAWAGERERRLEGDEEQRLYASARKGRVKQGEWCDLIAFALETCMRTQEILNVQVLHFDSKKSVLKIPAEIVKTEKGRDIPLSPISIEIIKKNMQGKEKSAKIFDSWSDSTQTGVGFKRICRRAGIEGLRFHDLRHEAISRLVECGLFSDSEIMKVSGHSELSTFLKYYNQKADLLVARMAEKTKMEKSNS